MKFDDPSYQGTYYDVSRNEKIAFPNFVTNLKDKLYSHKFLIGSSQIEHERSIFSLFDLIGNLGGV